MPTILDPKSFAHILKDINNYAQEHNGSIEYEEMKSFFRGYSLTADQAEMIWNYLDEKCIFVLHIDENDSLFSCLPEKERDEQGNIKTGNSRYDSVYSDALSRTPIVPTTAAVNGREDMYNVKTDSLLIAQELLRRTGKEDLPEGETSMMSARKLAMKLRPNEMHALVMYWRLEAGSLGYTIGQIGSVTGIDPASLEDLEDKAMSCAPKVGKSKPFSFLKLFKKN